MKIVDFSKFDFLKIWRAPRRKLGNSNGARLVLHDVLNRLIPRACTKNIRGVFSAPAVDSTAGKHHHQTTAKMLKKSRFGAEIVLLRESNELRSI